MKRYDANAVSEDVHGSYVKFSDVEALEERERMRLAGISTAAFGYHKASDPIHEDYKTVALDDVYALYQKYDAKYKQTDALKGILQQLKTELLSESDPNVKPNWNHAKNLCDSALKALGE